MVVAGCATLDLRPKSAMNGVMTKPSESLQDSFLGRLCESKGASTIFLINGVKLQGVITASDETSVLLRRESHEQLVYKHAISTIMPHNHTNVSGKMTDPEKTSP